MILPTNNFENEFIKSFDDIAEQILMKKNELEDSKIAVKKSKLAKEKTRLSDWLKTNEDGEIFL